MLIISFRLKEKSRYECSNNKLWKLLKRWNRNQLFFLSKKGNKNKINIEQHTQILS